MEDGTDPRPRGVPGLALVAPSLKEHRWIVIVQIGRAPDTDVVEQCTGCGLVRHLTERHCPPQSSSAVLRYFRNGLPALPKEYCK